MGLTAQEDIQISPLFHLATGKYIDEPEVFEDNQGVPKIAKNDANGNHTKHVDLRHDLVLDLLNEKKLRPYYCASDDMVANILTKSLRKLMFQKHYLGIG